MEREILYDLQLVPNDNHVWLFKTALERMLYDDYKVVIRNDKRPAGIHKPRSKVSTINEVVILIVDENLKTRDIMLTYTS